MRAATALNRVLDLPGTYARPMEVRDDGDVVVEVRFTRLPRCECGLIRPVYDRRERHWRHLDIVGSRLLIRARIRRVICPDCGVKTEQLAWARPGARHTIAFEHQVAWLTQQANKTAVSHLLRVAWETVGAIAARVVADHLPVDRLDGLRRIGVDEISYRFGHRYLTVVVDHDTGHVVWVAEGKSAASFGSLFEALGPKRSAQIQAISMDMTGTYRSAAKRYAPQAAICLDPFHVIQWASRALDTALSQATRQRHGLGLRGKAWSTARFALRNAKENLSSTQLELIHQLREQREELFEAWDLKEALRDLYRIDPADAPAHFDAWLQAASQAASPAMRALAERLRPHRAGILAAIEHHLSNARVEGINARIRLIHRRGYGYHTAAALTALIYLCCSSLRIELRPTRT